MKKIYIAGPYTIGDVARNVKTAMDYANKIIEMGHAPYCPHLTHFLHMNNFQPYEKWLELDLIFLLLCNAVLRIPGESKGADMEVEFAKMHNIPVYYSLEECSHQLTSSYTETQ